MKKTLLAIDGNSLLYRAFYALPLMQNKNGDYTNAIYGFVGMLFSAIEKVNPTHIVVAFDKKGKVFRHESFKEYKAGRKPMPTELVFQFPLLKTSLEMMGIQHIELEGYEADDILGSFAKTFKKHDCFTYVLTGDRDAFQLIDENTNVFLTKKGVSQSVIVDENELNEMYTLAPNQMIDMKGLMGDASDNIPGVKGVGEKTAIKLLSEYHTLENIYENITNIKGALQNKLINDKDNAFMSKEIGTIYTDLDLVTNIDDYNMPTLDSKTLTPVFKDLGFKSYLKRYGDEHIDKKEINVIAVENTSLLNELIKKLSTADIFSIIWQKDIFISLNEDVEHQIICDHSLLNTEFTLTTVLDLLSDVLQNESIKKIVFDGKELMHKLDKYDLSINGIDFDVKLAEYVLDPTQKSFELDALSEKYDLSGNSALLFSAFNTQKEELKESDIEYIYYDLEMPLMNVLYDMEQQGFKVDILALNELKTEFDGKINDLVASIYKLSGYDDFNINSTKQLGEVLFERLNLPVQKKTKTGYSTNIDVLEKLKDHHPVIENIIEYRKLTKLKSTYIDGLLNLVDSKGKIHSTFNQISTATGRISSTEPNLQNIPIRTEEGRNIRKAFIASSDDRVLVSADYSQIELRVLADIAHDSNMIDAFSRNQDIHARTASQVFDVALNEVTSNMRSEAKAVNFGIVYGISGFGLARNLNISVNRANVYIEKYLQEFDGISKYMEDIKAQAKLDGYVKTKFGRIRYLREISSSNFNVRSFGERAALNTPIQGTAADIIKIAMVKVAKQLKDSGLKSKLILQVHDELIIDTFKDEQDKVIELLRDIMQNIYDGDVCLITNISAGDTWYEAK